MSIVDKVLDIIENDLNIKISKKKKQIINDKFYPDIKDKIYWSYRIENSFYEGIISKEEYEKIKTLPPKTNICFGEIAKYVYDDGILENFPFTEDKNEIIKFYDRGGKSGENYFDLIEYFYDCDIFVYSDDN
jgi:hypothetical protein